jgi:hypothetical protein
MSIELPPGQDDDFFKIASMKANRIFELPYDDFHRPLLTKPNPTILTFAKAKVPDKEKNPAWSTATSELTEIENQQHQEIVRLKEKQAQALQATLKANQIIEAQRAEIEELKAQRLADNEIRIQEALEAKTAQNEDAKKLRNELRGEMKSMMQQFMESFKIPQAAKTPESNKRPMVNAEAHDSPPSEKRRDDRTTPFKLFPKEMDLGDSTNDADAMVADESNEDEDHDLRNSRRNEGTAKFQYKSCNTYK